MWYWGCWYWIWRVFLFLALGQIEYCGTRDVDGQLDQLVWLCSTRMNKIGPAPVRVDFMSRCCRVLVDDSESESIMDSVPDPLLLDLARPLGAISIGCTVLEGPQDQYIFSFPRPELAIMRKFVSRKTVVHFDREQIASRTIEEASDLRWKSSI